MSDDSAYQGEDGPVDDDDLVDAEDDDSPNPDKPTPDPDP